MVAHRSEVFHFADDFNRYLEIDREISRDFRSVSHIYRGFNVPTGSSVWDFDRDTKRWSRLEQGRSVYFTLSPKRALSFACLRKSSLAWKLVKEGRLKADQQKILEGRITVARYRIPVDDIILYQHAITICESECICKPKDAKLLNYRFYGFDDFRESLNSYREWSERLKRNDIEMIREMAFAKIPKAKRPSGQKAYASRATHHSGIDRK